MHDLSKLKNTNKQTKNTRRKLIQECENKREGGYRDKYMNKRTGHNVDPGPSHEVLRSVQLAPFYNSSLHMGALGYKKFLYNSIISGDYALVSCSRH